MPPLVEICVDDVAGALAAESEGADRVELCASLVEGGITPSLGLVKATLDRVRRVGVQVMIRPRGGDFVVSAEEMDAMLADIAAIRSLFHHEEVVVGFVFGALTPEGDIDVAGTARLVAACGPAPRTFHKAFDAARDLPAALETLISLGMRRVLTSGGAATALEGAPVLAGLAHQAAGRIGILAGGGVRAANIAALLAATGVGEVHLRAMRPGPGRDVTCADDIRAFLRASRGAP